MKNKGFTLIELLVVISVIALLMAVLMPVLGRVRKQAKALACQAKLRQWGLALQAYVAENDGKLPTTVSEQHGYLGALGAMRDRKLQHGTGGTDVLLCPMAARPPGEPWHGATFRAWRSRLLVAKLVRVNGSDGYVNGSYGYNMAVADPAGFEERDEERRFLSWATMDAGQGPRIPCFFDCTDPSLGSTGATDNYSLGPPPPFEDSDEPRSPSCQICINRHDGGINMCFLDGSVRKVGLKELWTLKWYRTYDTANEWTKAGGVQPEDWPEWMRRFKDY
jgi:prepilin-type N-terminal cleavage/methylation domain-containing protein/prepilin-type processing-associated H-X9-DG protein